MFNILIFDILSSKLDSKLEIFSVLALQGGIRNKAVNIARQMPVGANVKLSKITKSNFKKLFF